MYTPIIDNFTKDELQAVANQSKSFNELILNLGYSTANGSNHTTVMKRIKKYGIDTSHFCRQKIVERNYENVFCLDSTCTQKVLRCWFLKYSDDSKCSICGQSKLWNGKELTMVLDHKNGNKHDNRFENLRWTCPNCGSQLSTFAGRNRKNK